MIFSEWEIKSEAAKKSYLVERLNKTSLPYLIEEYKTFTLNGIELSTFIVQIKGYSFVFIPGNKVVLGWNDWETSINEFTQHLLREEEEFIHIKPYVELIRSVTTPVREREMPAFLVQQVPTEIGIQPIPFDQIPASLYLSYDHFIKDTQTKELEINKEFRFIKTDQGIKIYLIQKKSYQQCLEELKQDGFSLLSEEEWEYVCGGGTHTLFRWGDSFYPDMDDPYTLKKDPDKVKKIMTSPNMFGLSFFNDPFKQELTSSQIYKGGDGGCQMHDSVGIFWGYLPLSSYYHSLYSTVEMEDVSNRFLRRMIKV